MSSSSDARKRSPLLIFGGAFVLLLAVPAALSLARGDGAVCITSASCALSALNPCQRHPRFALLGRCAIAVR